MFAYCNNSPANSCDPCGACKHRLDFWNDCEACGGETFIEKADNFVQTAHQALDAIYYDLTYWHYEGRSEKNGNHPSYDEVNALGSGWRLLPHAESLYHDDGIGKNEEKYIKPDGSEAVFNGDTHEPMTDSKYMATYNYVALYELPDSGATVCDYVAFTGSYVGHFFADVLPYWLLGNTREDIQKKINYPGRDLRR